MTILALDTSTHWLSVAVGGTGGNGTCDDACSDAWTARNVEVGPGHSGQILPLIQSVLQEARVSLPQLQAIAFGAGPGSFTGVRIACGVAQGLALGLSASSGAVLPLVPICGLLAMAEARRRQTGDSRVWAVLDARMKEIYAGAWRHEHGRWHEVVAPQVGKPEDMVEHLQAVIRAEPALDGEWSVVGDALTAYPSLLQAMPWRHADSAVRPEAAMIGALAVQALARGETVQARDALPMYVRQRVALTSAERAAGAVL